VSTNPPAAEASAAIVEPPGPAHFSGSYVASPGTLFVPDAEAWSGVKFRGEDAGALGEGSLSFTLEADGGALAGELEGPLGPATLAGSAAEGSLSFHVTPRDGDLAFSGTGTGSLDGGSAEGEIHVSSWRGNVLRQATFHAQKR